MKVKNFLYSFSTGKMLLLVCLLGMVSCYHAPRTSWTPGKPKRAKPDVYPR